jgi:acetyl-CoA carboxylase biotin carboxyl carrier protein
MAETKVLSELTARVLKIEATPGAEIGPDDTLMLLESMKMEIPVLAPRGGRVKRIAVSEGESVEEGQLLFVLE